MTGNHPPSRPVTCALRLFTLIIVGVGAVSCGESHPEGLPDKALVLVVSSDLGVGRERVLVSAIDRDNRSLVIDQPVRLAFFGPDGAARDEVEARFIWAIPEVRGMWVAEVTFDTPGTWTLAVRTPDDRLVRSAPFGVSEESLAVKVGDAAPPSRSKTPTDGPMESITSDPSPDPRLYEITVADAVGSGHPSVIVFATPAFCISHTCGPTLDTVKELIDHYPEVNWVHVEVYDNLDAATAEALVLTEPVIEWGLPTEPWVYVVDSGGTVTDRFEGVVDRTELEKALDRIKG